MSREKLLTTPFVLCSISNFLQGIGFSLFLHVPAFLEQIGAGPVAIGWIFSVMALVAIAARPGLGVLMDRHGRRALILGGNLLNVAVLGLYLTITEIGPWVYVVRVLHGLAEATLFTVLFTYAADHVPSSRLTEGLAIFGVSGMLPMSLSGVLGDVILERAGFDALFMVAWGFALAALIAALPLRDALPAQSGERHPGEPHGFMASVRRPELLPIWWVSAVFFTALAAIFIFLKTMVMTRGVGSVGSFFTAYTAVAIALRLFAGWLPDRVGSTRVLVPALLSIAAGFFVLAFASRDVDVIAAGVLCGIGHGYTFPILFGLVVRRTPERDRGSAVAVYTGLSDLGVVMGGPLLGWVLERWSYETLYMTAAAFVILGTSLFVPWDARVARTIDEGAKR
jgi:MFS family permease